MLGSRKEGRNSGGCGDLRGLAGGHTLRQGVHRMALEGVGSLGRETRTELVLFREQGDWFDKDGGFKRGRSGRCGRRVVTHGPQWKTEEEGRAEFLED